jgi:hypothetical protein
VTADVIGRKKFVTGLSGRNMSVSSAGIIEVGVVTELVLGASGRKDSSVRKWSVKERNKKNF